jgi:CHAT domain-containing protein/tetratricopeptide (TPR) repeat protein
MPTWTPLLAFGLLFPLRTQDTGTPPVQAAEVDELEQAETLFEQVLLLRDEGRYAEALAVAERVLAIHERLLGTEHPTTLTSRNAFAVTLYYVGRLDEAAEVLAEVLVSKEAVHGSDSPELVSALDTLGYIRGQRGRFDEAEPLYRRALAIHMKAHGSGSADEARVRSNLSRTLTGLGRHGEARAEAEVSVAIAREKLGAVDPSTLIYERMLAETMASAGNYVESIPLLERVYADHEEHLGPEHTETMLCLESLAGDLRAAGRSSEALPMVERVLVYDERVYGPEHPYTIDTKSDLGSLYFRLGRVDEAVAIYEDIVATRDRLETAPTIEGSSDRFVLGHMYQSLGELAAARELKSRALEMATVVYGPRHRTTGHAIGDFAALLAMMGENREAWGRAHLAARIELGSFDRNVPGGAEWEATPYAFTKRWFVDLAISLAHRLDDPDRHRDTYALALAWKGRTARLLAGHRARLAAELDEEGRRLIEELRFVQSELTQTIYGGSGRAELERLREERIRLERDLLAGARTTEAPPEVTPEDVRRALPDDTVAIDFRMNTHFVTDPKETRNNTWGFGEGMPHLTAWVLHRDRPLRAIDLGPAERVRDAIYEYRTAITKRSAPVRGITPGTTAAPVETPDSGHRLREWLIDPLAPLIGDAKRVVIAADDFLVELPFEVIPTGGGGFLVEAYAFVYQPSLAELPALLEASERGAGGRALVVGDVDYGGLGTWAQLPATAQEGGAVAARAREHLGEQEVAELSGEGASAEAFGRLAVGRRWLHVATHGFFEPPAGGPAGIEALLPGLSTGLVFADANDSPAGLLTAEQVAWLELAGCDLVVLSACETAMGTQRKGDGMISLQRAFRLAGARAVVSSLWSVEDVATRELMTRFYEGLWVEGRGRGDALRAAQLRLLEEGRERGDPAPRNWGAFVLSGDWR